MAAPLIEAFMLTGAKRADSKRSWLLTIVALAMAAFVAMVAGYMIVPVDWTGPGKFGTAALIFPLHVFVITVLAAALWLMARRRVARLAASLFALTALTSAMMAVVPSVLVLRRAGELGVTLSLGEYLAHATSANSGEPQPERSVVYGVAADGTQLWLDVWPAEHAVRAAAGPAVVFVHGGGWIHGTRSGAPRWDSWLNQLGYDVFDVEYRLPPPARWRDEVGDVKCALGWLAIHASDYHVDPRRISIMGYSSGGNVSMLVAYSAGDPELPPSCPVPTVAVRSVVNLYGPSDLTIGYDRSGSLEYVQPAMRQYLGGTPTEYPERYRLVSPLHHVTASTPATITFLGQSDRLVTMDQAEMLRDALVKAGVPQETYFLPACDHGFDFNWGGWGTQIARSKIAEFLRRHDTER